MKVPSIMIKAPSRMLEAPSIITLNHLKDLSEINRVEGDGNIELKVGNEVTHLSNRNEISLPSPWA